MVMDVGFYEKDIRKRVAVNIAVIIITDTTFPILSFMFSHNLGDINAFIFYVTW